MLPGELFCGLLVFHNFIFCHVISLQLMFIGRNLMLFLNSSHRSKHPRHRLADAPVIGNFEIDQECAEKEELESQTKNVSDSIFFLRLSIKVPPISPSYCISITFHFSFVSLLFAFKYAHNGIFTRCSMSAN